MIKHIATDLAFDRFNIAKFEDNLTVSFYNLGHKSTYIGGGKLTPTYGPRNKVAFINGNHRHLSEVQTRFISEVPTMIEATGYLKKDARFGLLKLEHTTLRVANLFFVWHLHNPVVYTLFSHPDKDIHLVEGVFEWHETRSGKKILRTEYLDNPYSEGAMVQSARERAAKMASSEDRRVELHRAAIQREENRANSVRNKISAVFGDKQ